MRKVEKITKILTIVMVVMMLATICTNVLAATSVNPSNFTGTTNGIQTGEVDKWVNNIINIVATIGSGAAIIILIVLGVKYMMGSAEEKAEYKKTLLPYIIGAIFVFGASALTGVLYNFINVK